LIYERLRYWIGAVNHLDLHKNLRTLRTFEERIIQRTRSIHSGLTLKGQSIAISLEQLIRA